MTRWIWCHTKVLIFPRSSSIAACSSFNHLIPFSSSSPNDAHQLSWSRRSHETNERSLSDGDKHRQGWGYGGWGPTGDASALSVRYYWQTRADWTGNQNVVLVFSSVAAYIFTIRKFILLLAIYFVAYFGCTPVVSLRTMRLVLTLTSRICLILTAYLNALSRPRSYKFERTRSMHSQLVEGLVVTRKAIFKLPFFVSSQMYLVTTVGKRSGAQDGNEVEVRFEPKKE